MLVVTDTRYNLVAVEMSFNLIISEFYFPPALLRYPQTLEKKKLHVSCHDR